MIRRIVAHCLLGMAAASAGAQEEAPKPPPGYPFENRIKAPGLDGGSHWINTAGPIELEALRGKFVVLDFWTYCCINCMHILPVLKQLEHKYPNEIVVIGVHSAKFDAEEDAKNIASAVLRYEIEHPVVNDPEHRIWTRYQCQSWPSLRIIDPLGYVVAGHSGEIDFETLDGFFRQHLPYYRKRGLLNETPVRFDLEAMRAASTPLRFPGKILADEAGKRLFITDSNHNRLVVTDLDGKLLDTIGSGAPGADDGDFASARFDHPQGLALDGDALYVADTENHLIRKVDLAEKRVTTIAGLGHQARNPWPGVGPEGYNDPPERFVGKPRKTALNSPWALWIHDGALFIAMAGPHQIWKMSLGKPEIGPYAGNGREDIVDGPLLPKYPYELGFASFAQPSGLASDGQRLFVADSEGSSIRVVPFDPTGIVETLIGTSKLPANRLFEFGDIDGAAITARLQHPLGVHFREGRLYIADTYNNKIKSLDLASGEVATLAGDGQPGADDDPPRFDEPAGLSSAAGKLYVADTNNHAIRVIDLAAGNRVSTLAIDGLAPPAPPPAAKPSFPNPTQVQLQPQRVKLVDGQIRVEISIELPEGYKFTAEAPLTWLVESEKATGAVDREAIGKAQTVRPASSPLKLTLPAAHGDDTLKLSLNYLYCREGSEGLCKIGSTIWEIPLTVAPEGLETLALQAKAQ